MNIFVGTSGWSYPEWKGVVYPNNLPQSKMFTYYSEFFYTTEINSTFYQIPSLNTAITWCKKSPPNFKFSAKIPDLITHKAKLDIDDSVGPLSMFLKNMMPLIQENKILAFLLQLPPKFGKDSDSDFKKLERFAQYWDKSVREQFTSNDIDPPELAIEFRNKYWVKNKIVDDTFNLLRQYNLVYCAVVEPLLPPIIDLTSDSLFYMRFHGFGTKPWFNYCFTNEQLEEWVEKLTPLVNATREQKNKKRRIALYFNNHFSGYAVKNALFLSQKMNLPIIRGIEDLTKPLKTLSKAQKKIDEFF